MKNHNQIDDKKDLDNLLEEKKIKDSPSYDALRRRKEWRKTKKKAEDDLVVLKSLLEDQNIIHRLDNIVNWMNENLSDMYDSESKLGLFSNFHDFGRDTLDFPIFYYTIKKSSLFRYKECIWITGTLRSELDSPHRTVLSFHYRNKRRFNESDGYYEDGLIGEKLFSRLKNYVVNL